MIRALPRLHLVTATELLADPEFASTATDLLWRVAETFSVPVTGSDMRPDSGAWASAAAPATLALHLRGEISGRRLHELAFGLRPAIEGAGALLLVNDRVDVALTAGADGTHLPVTGLGVTAARAILGSHALVGASVHDEDEAQRAAGADFHLFGSVWETASHPGRRGAGVDALDDRASAVDAPPTLAIGGVTPERVAEVAGTRAHGVAVLSGIWHDPSPSDAAIRYLQAVSEAFNGGA